MKKIFFVFFVVFSLPLWAIDFTTSNYDSLIGKTLVLLPNSYSDFYIGSKKFNSHKYRGTKFFIRDIKVVNKRITIFLDQTTDKGKIKTITVKSSDGTITTKNVGVLEDLEEAKTFFIGKQLLATGNMSYVHYSHSFDRLNEGDSCSITNVEWGRNDKDKYKLITDKKYFIYTQDIAKSPDGFVISDSTGISPDLYKLKISKDDLEGTVFKSFTNLLSVPVKDKDLYDVLSVHFYATQFIDKGIKTTPELVIGYYADSWLFIESVALYIDGKREDLNIGRDDRTVLSTGAISEYFHFPTTKNQLKQISSAKEIVLRLAGKRGVINAELTPQNIYNFKRFYEQEIK